ncbi:hypothetical protein R8Z50_26410 [Longispora sp. K20-0274]|uniref:hypothetical protein n=1 Tax=Longispora sp. K20-0274 TaxID=3088255 RepID=UPI00399B6284
MKTWNVVRSQLPPTPAEREQVLEIQTVPSLVDALRLFDEQRGRPRILAGVERVKVVERES